jgi:hypothetical protein
MNQFIVIEKTGSYQYYINYTLTNDTPDKKYLKELSSCTRETLQESSPN